MSGLATALAVLAFGAVVGWIFERQFLAQEEANTAGLVQAQARQHLVATDFVVSGPERPAFAAFLRELPDVFRIKVFEGTGRIVWSDESRLVGLAFSDNPYLARALRGDVAAVLEVPERPEHLYEQAIAYVAETYVPITLPGRDGVIGVIETYKDATRLVLGIRQTQRLSWAVGAGMGSVLYTALALVVWRASRAEHRAATRLVEQERLAAVGQAIVGLHHSVLNPLAGILGALQVVKDGAVSPAAQAVALAQAEAEARRIEQLIRGLPALRRAAGTPYVHGTTMLELDPGPE